jgi:hypothetical protein
VYHEVCGKVGLLDVSCLLDGFLLDDLYPVTIGVKHKGNMAHAAVRKLLLEFVAGILEALAGRLDVVDADACVTKTAVRLLVAVVYGIFGVILRAIIVRKLDKALSVEGSVAMGQGLGAIIAEKVQIELGVRELKLLDHTHTKKLVKLD